MSENPPPTPDDDPFTPPLYGSPMPPPSPFGPSQPLPPPGYGPPAYGPPPGYGPPGYGPPAYGPPPGYALPAQYYAGPEDPLVSNDIGGWWNRSLQLLRKAWRPLLLVHLISVPPLGILSAWAQAAAKNDIGTDPDNVTASDLRTLLVRLAVAVLVGALLSVVVSLSAQRILVQAATDRPISIGAALLDGLRRTPALIGWGIPVGLMVIVGLFFCIVPGLYFGAVFTVLPAIVLLERGNAISRSFQLLHADIGAALGRIVIYYAVSFLFVIVQGLFTSGVAGIGTSTAGTVASTGVGIVCTLVSAVAITPMVLTTYADMRARHEPFSTAYLAPAE